MGTLAVDRLRHRRRRRGLHGAGRGDRARPLSRASLGSPLSYSGDDARYPIDEESGVLSVTEGIRRWRYSPAGWLSVEDTFGESVLAHPTREEGTT